MQHKKYCIFPGSSVSKKRLPTNHTFTNHPLSSSLPTEIKPAMVIFIVCCFYGLMPVNISPLDLPECASELHPFKYPPLSSYPSQMTVLLAKPIRVEQ